LETATEAEVVEENNYQPGERKSKRDKKPVEFSDLGYVEKDSKPRPPQLKGKMGAPPQKQDVKAF
jgi:hypothetical protein